VLGRLMIVWLWCMIFLSIFIGLGRWKEAEERVIGKLVDGFSGVCLDVGCGTGRYSLRIAENGVLMRKKHGL